MQEILWLLLNNLNYEKAQRVNQFVRVPWIDVGDFSPKILDQMPSPRVFKSHLHAKFFPENFDKTIKVL